MGDRFNIGREVRELKLGTTFGSHSATAFHTIKYDFKPASVDLNRTATVDIGSNNQVTVTVPNLEGAGVPNTVFKGNQRKYTKECLIIFDKKTGVVTLEKLNHNIQVKKTRSEPPPNKYTLPPQKLAENSTMRTQSKTKVSTGNRKNNMIGFTPRMQGSPMQQGSPSSSYSSIIQRRSPQQAPVWNANNGQATLPSFPILTDDVDEIVPIAGNNTVHTSIRDTHMNANSSASSSSGHNSSLELRHKKQQQQQQQLQFLQNQPQQHQHNHHHLQPHLHYSLHNNPSSHHNTTINSSSTSSSSTAAQSLAVAAAALEKEIGVLSSSDSGTSSSSDSSDSDSDSDSDLDNHQPINQNNNLSNHYQTHNNYSTTAAVLLHDDLQLSESNSDDDTE